MGFRCIAVQLQCLILHVETSRAPLALPCHTRHEVAGRACGDVGGPAGSGGPRPRPVGPQQRGCAEWIWLLLGALLLGKASLDCHSLSAVQLVEAAPHSLWRQLVDSVHAALILGVPKPANLLHRPGQPGVLGVALLLCGPASPHPFLPHQHCLQTWAAWSFVSGSSSLWACKPCSLWCSKAPPCSRCCARWASWTCRALSTLCSGRRRRRSMSMASRQVVLQRSCN